MESISWPSRRTWATASSMVPVWKEVARCDQPTGEDGVLVGAAIQRLLPLASGGSHRSDALLGYLLQIGEIAARAPAGAAGGSQQSAVTGIHDVEDMLGRDQLADGVAEFSHGDVLVDGIQGAVVGDQVSQVAQAGLLLVAVAGPEEEEGVLLPHFVGKIFRQKPHDPFFGRLLVGEGDDFIEAVIFSQHGLHAARVVHRVLEGGRFW